MNSLIEWTCPFCGHENKVSVEIRSRSGEVLLACCDSEEGGCDKSVVLKVSVALQSRALKIQEETE